MTLTRSPRKEDILDQHRTRLMTEKDDPAQAQLLRGNPGGEHTFRGSIVVAAATACTGKRLHAAAETMKYLEDHTDTGMGNFRFAAIANVPAYTPFYPASYHQGLGHQFAIALESANVVAARDGRAARSRKPRARC